MFAGLPGTGVGGMLYVLLTLWMPIHELILMARGRSTPGRWRFIFRHWCLFLGVVTMIVGQTALMMWIIPAQEQRGVKAPVISSGTMLPEEFWLMMTGTALMSAISLCVVVLLLHFARAVLRVRRVIGARGWEGRGLA